MTVYSQRLPLTIDPLIEEAKQRTRRRRLLLAAALAGVAALAVGLTLALRPGGLGMFRSSGALVPAGVEEVDIRQSNASSRPTSLRVTNPTQVNSVVAWFNGLTRLSQAPANMMCAGGSVANIVFTFRGAGGAGLATANSSPTPTGFCNPIHFTVGAKPQAFLYDPSGVHPLISRVEELVGVKFAPSVHLG
jgi:hypothetical protein